MEGLVKCKKIDKNKKIIDKLDIGLKSVLFTLQNRSPISLVIIFNKSQAFVWLELGFFTTKFVTFTPVISCSAVGGSLCNSTW